MRKDIPDRQKPLKALLPQVESLENGISDLSRWIDEGEKLLATHKVDGDINMLEDRLDKHKVFLYSVALHRDLCLPKFFF